jgi:hypothetical protein
MNWHRRIMALGFRFAGFLLAMTSLVVLEEAGYSAYVVHNAPPPDNSAPLDIGKYGLVGLLTNGAQVAGRAVHTLSFAAAWVLAAVAIVAFVVFLLAVLIYFTGGGISRQRGWARVVGVLLSLVLALITIPALFVIDRGAIPVVAVPAVLSLYTVWALIWRYA